MSFVASVVVQGLKTFLNPVSPFCSYRPNYCESYFVYDQDSNDDILTCMHEVDVPRYYANHTKKSTWENEGKEIYLHGYEKKSIITSL